MSRTPIYPWETLQRVGDYFIVLESYRPQAHYFMNATVAQRNKQKSGQFKYCCIKTSYGCIVMLAQIGEDIPPYDYEVVEGVLGVATFDGSAKQELGNKPLGRELTQQELVMRMSHEVKMFNLPWWRESNGKLFMNHGVAKKRDIEKWARGEFNPGPNDPYPEYYDLGPDLLRRGELDLTEDEEDELFGTGADAVMDEENTSDGDDT